MNETQIIIDIISETLNVVLQYLKKTFEKETRRMNITKKCSTKMNMRYELLLRMEKIQALQLRKDNSHKCNTIQQ